jgi:GTP-binding protein
VSADVIAGIEEPNRIFSGPVTFLKSAPKLEFLPEPTVPEIAFAGRSNVGKSSLINALVNRNNLARASNTPGYGYAKAPLKTVQQWRYLINDYLRGRAVLKRVFVLIDSRHGIKEVDHDIMGMLDAAAISYRIVLTKTDKIKATEREAVEADTMAKLRKHVAAIPTFQLHRRRKRAGLMNCAARC